MIFGNERANRLAFGTNGLDDLVILVRIMLKIIVKKSAHAKVWRILMGN